MKENKIKILLAGTGGQGVQTLAHVLSHAAFKSNMQVSLVSNYGLEQRGGMSLAYLQISTAVITAPRFSEPDYLFLMSEEARPRIVKYIKKTKHFIETEKYKEILKQNDLGIQSFNVLLLGIVSKLLCDSKLVSEKIIREELKNKLGEKKNWEENLKAFEVGFNKS